MVGLSCDDLVEGLALTAALSIDPNATVTLGGAPESEPAPVLAPEVPTVVTQAESELPGDAPGSDEFAGSDGTGLRVVLGGLVTAQKVVDQTVLVGGGVQLLLSGSGNRAIFPFEFRLSVEGLADPRNRDGADIFTDMVMIGGAYCPLRIGTPHSFSICAAADLGALFAQSRGFEQSGEVGRFFASAALEGWFRARLSERVELWVSPALTVPLTERQFAVEPGPEILSSTVTVGWSGSIGVAWRF
jgi:hypothetical protein